MSPTGYGASHTDTIRQEGSTAQPSQLSQAGAEAARCSPWRRSRPRMIQHPPGEAHYHAQPSQLSQAGVLTLQEKPTADESASPGEARCHEHPAEKGGGRHIVSISFNRAKPAVTKNPPREADSDLMLSK